MIEADLHNDFWKLTRHKCYKDHAARKNRESQLAKHDDDSDTDEEVLFLNKIKNWKLKSDKNDDESDDDNEDEDRDDNTDNDDDENDDKSDEQSDDGLQHNIDGFQHTILALNLYRFGKLSVKHGGFSSKDIKRFLPKSFDAVEW